MTAMQLYDRDFFEWTQCNAALLRAGRFDVADIEHIAEEIEDIGKRERRELESRLEVLLQHILKWQAQPERRGTSWLGTIELQRLEINKLLEEMPSLKNALGSRLSESYKRGVLRASIETELPKASFPKLCPFTLDQILDPDFLP
jgi:hypothetical protein